MALPQEQSQRCPDAGQRPGPLPRDPRSLGAAIATRAEATRRLVRKDFHLDISMDKLRGKLLNATHASWRAHFPGSAPGARESPLEFTFRCEFPGAWFGAMCRSRAGGYSKVVEWKGQRIHALSTESGRSCAAEQRAGKHLLIGKGDVLLFLFGVSSNLAEAARRIARLSTGERSCA